MNNEQTRQVYSEIYSVLNLLGKNYINKLPTKLYQLISNKKNRDYIPQYTMDISLEKNERIDDLQYKGLKIIQDKTAFCFGIDSVLLSDFAKEIKNNSKVADLGTGNGIVGLLLCKKTKLNQIIGVEIQEEIAEMAERSIKLNDLEEQFKIVNVDINDIFKKNVLQKNTYDAVVMNPPYKEVGKGKTNENSRKLIARHEVKATLSDFIKVAARLLKDKGEVYVVHKPERIVDIMQEMRANKIEPKKMRLVYPYENETPSIVLIKGVKGGKKFFSVDKPLVIYQNNGEYTQDIKNIYIKNN